MDFATVLGNFKRYRESEFGWMVGRLIVPASRLPELEGSAVPVSVLAGDHLAEDLQRIRNFQRQQAGSIESIEVKGATVEIIRAACETVQSDIPLFFEISARDASDSLVAAIAEKAECAKIRTGGITAGAIPASADVARFLQLCAVYGVPFKATAGLHHAVRGSHSLTYKAQSPSARMHGFLNIFLAAGFARNRMPPETVSELIEEQRPEAFQFSDNGVRWRRRLLTSDEILAMRSQFAVSFGSCSVEEPVADLAAMGLL